jgi:hypothetical protein
MMNSLAIVVRAIAFFINIINLNKERKDLWDY